MTDNRAGIHLAPFGKFGHLTDWVFGSYELHGRGRIWKLAINPALAAEWLNPERIAERHLTANDVVAAIQEQNVQVAAGVIGGAPYADIAELQLPVNTKGRLESSEEFEQIIIRAGEDGQITRLKDVANIEIGAS